MGRKEREKQEKKDKRLQRCEIAANLVLYHGPIQSDRVNDKIIAKYCDDEHPPCAKTLSNSVRSKNVKWYIRNHMEPADDIWTGDFILGITKAGKVNWPKHFYPSFTWWSCPHLAKALENSPYVGQVANNKGQKEKRHPYRWKRAPALYLKGSEDSMGYVAGLLATGRQYVNPKEDKVYALYTPEVMEELEKLGIPMIGRSYIKGQPLISPFWPAIFTKLMPPEFDECWLNLKKTAMAEDYAAVLWMTYVGSKFKKKAIPYLKSRRTTYSRFGTLENLQRARVKFDLVSLDEKIRHCIRLWYNDSK
jgi:hypothetical protein